MHAKNGRTPGQEAAGTPFRALFEASLASLLAALLASFRVSLASAFAIFSASIAISRNMPLMGLVNPVK